MKSNTSPLPCSQSSPKGPANSSATSSGESEPSNPARVVIVEDEEGVRLSLKVIVDGSGAFACAGAFANAETALRRLPVLKPDLVLMDINLPGMSGIECLRKLKTHLPHVTVVMVSGLSDRETVQLAAQAGCSDFVTKPFNVPQLLATLYVVMEQSTRRFPTGHWVERWNLLTERERAIVRLIADGLRNKEIAESLKTCSNTIGSEIQVVFHKLRIHSRAECVEYLHRNEGFEGNGG